MCCSGIGVMDMGWCGGIEGGVMWGMKMMVGDWGRLKRMLGVVEVKG